MAHYVWTDERGRGRNRFGLFRRAFTLTGKPFSAAIRVWADTRYRLTVNGVVLGHGPARFFRAKPEYDEVDLTEHLQAGENVVAVVAHSMGAVHYQGEVSEAALIAWGEVRDELGEVLVDFATPGEWVCTESPGHVRETHGVSFALGPAERLDLREMPFGWESPGFDDSGWGGVVERKGTEYGPMVPRSIPPLDEREILPRGVAGVFAGTDEPGEDVYSMIVVAEERQTGVAPLAAAVTYIHSTGEHEVTFFGWWGRYFLNGEEVKGDHRDEPRRRQRFVGKFRDGWNVLVCSERFHWAAWELYLRFPSAAGLKLSATRRVGSAAVFGVVGPAVLSEEIERLERVLPDLGRDGPEAEWKLVTGSDTADSPHRQRAARNWRRLPAEFSGDISAAVRDHPADSVSVLYDMGAEVLGRAKVSLTAPAGTTLDLAYTESLDDDGRAHVHQRYLVDLAERYTLRGGGATIYAFHPRGGRYVELTLTPPAGGGWEGVQIDRIAMTRAVYPVEPVGRFECSDPTLNSIWRLGAATQAVCMEDAYLDCPGRERGLYVGDMLVQFFVNLAAFGDTKLFRRSLELFLLSADLGENGLVAGGAHGIPPGRHPDYSALIPWMLIEYFARTGDLDFLAAQRKRVLRLMDGLEATTVPGGALVDGSDLGIYIDTAAHDHSGINAPTNAFAYAAFFHASEFFRRTGDAALGHRFSSRAASLAQAFNENFWDDARGVYLDRRRADKPDTTPSVHGNALALLFDIAPPDRAALAEAHLLATLVENRRQIPPRHAGDFHVSPYFSFYVLTALLRRGHGPFVLDFIRRNWSVFLDAGAVATWEYFSPDASLCHAWSASPTHFLSTHVLGVSFPFPGDPSRVRIAPDPCGLAFAEGVYPHPTGPISVRWTVVGGKLRLAYTLPRGVTAV